MEQRQSGPGRLGRGFFFFAECRDLRREQFSLALTAGPAVAVDDGQTALPTEFALEQNYPNPFNPTTVISSQLPVASEVKLAVYDLLGREVAALVSERREAGSYQDTFDGSALASGVYVYRLTAGSFVASKQMMLVK